MKKLLTLILSVAFLASVSAEESKDKKDEAAEGGLSSLSGILPKGKVHKGITYPIFENGKLSTVLIPKEMVRRDEEYLDIDDMLIELYSPAGEIDYTIKLLTALYHMPTEQLSSNDRTLIEGKSFTLEGDTMVYDTTKNICRMTGNIRMVITNPSAMMSKPAPKPEPKAQTPTPEPDPNAKSQTPTSGPKPESE